MLNEFLFVDDCTLNSNSESGMQAGMDHFSDVCDDFGLTISAKKTAVMYQPASGKEYVEPTITVHGQRLEPDSKFTYLGNSLSIYSHADDKVTSWTAKARAAFGRLCSTLWECRGISLRPN